jgi:hypothetical protein
MTKQLFYTLEEARDVLRLKTTATVREVRGSRETY